MARAAEAPGRSWPPPRGTEGSSHLLPNRRWPAWVESAAVALLSLGIFVVHDVGYVLRHPFWLDEAWLAASTKAPLGALFGYVHASAPIGFTVLLRFVPFGFDQGLRMVPLVFAAGAVAVAYLLGRELHLAREAGGFLLAVSVLFLPAMLVRNDLKQYTAEAFFSLLLLLLLARLEATWTRQRLGMIAVASVVGMLFANTVLFTSTAVFGSLVLVSAWRRNWSALRETVVAGAVAAAGLVTIYVTTLASIRSEGLVNFWATYFIPTDHGISGVIDFLRTRGTALAPSLGTSNIALIAGMVLLGLVVLVWMRRPALALCVPLVVIGNALAGALRLYPFLDLRTSTFWLVMVAVLMAIGLAGVVGLLARNYRAIAAVVLVAGVGTYVYAAAPKLRAHTIPNEDVRAQIRYVEDHRSTGDVVIISFPATFGASYYSRTLEPTFHRGPGALYRIRFPHAKRVIAMQGRQTADVDRALRDASSRSRGSGFEGVDHPIPRPAVRAVGVGEGPRREGHRAHPGRTRTAHCLSAGSPGGHPDLGHRAGTRHAFACSCVWG